MAGSRPFGLTAPLGSWRPLDRWGAGYALLTGAVQGAFALRGAPGAARGALVSLGALAFIVLMARWTRDTRRPLPTLLRLFTLPMLYTVFYRQVAVLWPLLRAAPLDGALAAWELRLFGTQPALAFQARWPWPWLSELFCLAYLAYYFLTPVVGLATLVRHGYLAAERLLLATTLCFLGCYVWFWLVPTVGPHYWFPPHLGPRPYAGYVCNHLLFAFTGAGEIPGAAFPSSHLAVALLLTLCARRLTPGLFPFLLPILLLLPAAVVYLHAHYLLDVPAGLLTGFLAYRLSRGLTAPPGRPGPG